MPDSTTHQVTARLSPDGYEGLTVYCQSHGVSVTAFMDALGQWLLDQEQGAAPTPQVGRVLTRVVEHGRAIDAQRRSRTKPLTVVRAQLGLITARVCVAWLIFVSLVVALTLAP